jgi:hypothetical protein
MIPDFQIVYNPYWFYGYEVVIDILTILVLLLIGVFSFRAYKINKNKHYFWLSAAFFMICAAHLFKIGAHFTVYYKVVEQLILPAGGILTFQAVRPSYIILAAGYFLYRVLTLLGLYGLYALYGRNQSKTDMATVSVLLFAISYFTHDAYYAFHIIAAVLLVGVVINYSKICRGIRQKTTRILAASFMVLALSHLALSLATITPLVSVIAELIHLAGLMLLLITFIMVLIHGKKKKQN